LLARERASVEIATGPAQVAKVEVGARSISHFRNADPDYGARIERSAKGKKG
jgi:catalase